MRTTTTEINFQLEGINELIKPSGSRWFLGQQYGSKSIDEGYTDPNRKYMSRTIISGLGKVPQRFYQMTDEKLRKEWESIAEERNYAFVH